MPNFTQVRYRTAPYRQFQRLDRTMQNCKIAQTETKVPYDSTNKEGLYSFTVKRKGSTPKLLKVPYYRYQKRERQRQRQRQRDKDSRIEIEIEDIDIIQNRYMIHRQRDRQREIGRGRARARAREKERGRKTRGKEREKEIKNIRQIVL